MDESPRSISSAQRFELLVDAVIDYAIYMLDTEGRISSWNRGARRIKGYEADEILGRLEEQSRQQYLRSEIMAMGYAALGDLDRAFACLERAFQVRSAGLIYLHVDPGYKPLRPDPRFRQLVERIGLR